MLAPVFCSMIFSSARTSAISLSTVLIPAVFSAIWSVFALIWLAISSMLPALTCPAVTVPLASSETELIPPRHEMLLHRVISPSEMRNVPSDMTRRFCAFFLNFCLIAVHVVLLRVYVFPLL